MARPVKTIDAKKFDYEKFTADLKAINKEKKMTMTRLSEEVALRSGSYLQKALSDKAVPVNVAIAVAKWAGLDLKDYEIKPVKKVKEKPVEETVEVEQKVEQSGWSCVIKVDEEFGMAMMKVFKDGKEIALGRSYTYGHDDTGIVQGISYAAHMCYKQVQQAKMAEESIRVIPDEPLEEEQLISDAAADDEMEEEIVGRMVFRDWIAKYSSDNSRAGKLARYVKSHYQHIPATGKKKIRSYIRLNKGEAHLQTFDSMWGMYVSWYNAQYDAGNVRLGMAV